VERHGSITGHPVCCISPQWLVKFHTGYRVDANDYHGVSLLYREFVLWLPEDYAEFAAGNRKK